MDPMLEAFRARAAEVRFEAPKIPMLSNVTGRLLDPGAVPGADYWCQHVRAPVRFAAEVDTLRALGCEVLLELGPHDTLVKTARRCLPEEASRSILSLASLAPDDDAERVQQAAISSLYLRGVPLDWRG